MDAMQKYVQPESYVNFPNRELTNWAHFSLSSIYAADRSQMRFLRQRSEKAVRVTLNSWS